ncbi:hypothetical protein BDZ89DRAFT_1051331 [Hymenopellis radicata]|nr:hypothetical protein BDZ89DRAFT_1051331 [Hymenopellis radicata]
MSTSNGGDSDGDAASLTTPCITYTLLLPPTNDKATMNSRVSPGAGSIFSSLFPEDDGDDGRQRKGYHLDVDAERRTGRLTTTAMSGRPTMRRLIVPSAGSRYARANVYYYSSAKKRIVRRRGRAVDSDDEIELDGFGFGRRFICIDLFRPHLTDRPACLRPPPARVRREQADGRDASFFAAGGSWSDMIADETINGAADLPVIDFSEFNDQALVTNDDSGIRMAATTQRRRRQDGENPTTTTMTLSPQ